MNLKQKFKRKKVHDLLKPEKQKSDSDIRKELNKNIKKRQREDEEYNIKNKNIIKVLGIIFWIILGFIFLRGIIDIFKPNEISQVESLIQDFEKRNVIKQKDDEVLAFSQNFIKEYLTFDDDIKDLQNRIDKYVSKNVISNMNTFINSNSRVIYANAYRKEIYSDNQLDVYIFVETEHIVKESIEEEALEKIMYNTAIIKVPIYVSGNRYIVEDLPVFINDNSYVFNDYEYKFYLGESFQKVNDDERKVIENLINNFYKSYYTDEQSVINYYLDDKADISNFIGLYGAFELSKVNEVAVYKNESNKYYANVKLEITDSVGIKHNQNFNITFNLSNDKSKLYIETMDSKTVNINLNN